MHAVVATVTIASGQFEAAQNALKHDVVPRVRQAPGFVKAYWTIGDDHMHGTSLVVFDTNAHADFAAGMARRLPTAPGVTMGAVEVREVVAEA